MDSLRPKGRVWMSLGGRMGMDLKGSEGIRVLDEHEMEALEPREGQQVVVAARLEREAVEGEALEGAAQRPQGLEEPLAPSVGAVVKNLKLHQRGELLEISEVALRRPAVPDEVTLNHPGRKMALDRDIASTS